MLLRISPIPQGLHSKSLFAGAIVSSSLVSLQCRHEHTTAAVPATAPRRTPDLKDILTRPEVYEQNCRSRNYAAHAGYPARIQKLLEEAKSIDQSLVEPRKQINQLEKSIGRLRASQKNEDAVELSDILAQIKNNQEQTKIVSKRQAEHQEEATSLALSLPNLTSPQTPLIDEPRVLRYLNYDPSKPTSYPQSADHSVIGPSLGILDFAASTTTTGWGFYYLLKEAALIEQALIQFAIFIAVRHGFQVITPPSLVYQHIANACGFQPRDQNDEQQIWAVEQAQKDAEAGKPKKVLAATAEIPLAAIKASTAIPEADLPLRAIGSSRCYRAEAGARGVDTKGLYRVHEFSKVEMFAWTKDDPLESEKIFGQMVAIQTQVLSALGLPCRILEMPSSDLGASAYRKIDIEAIFPSRLNAGRDGGWGEVTSVSMCTDYQARRLDTRIVEKSGKKNRFAWTLNGTAMAVPRVLAAIIEHGWREETQTIVVPDILRPYLKAVGCQDGIIKKT